MLEPYVLNFLLIEMKIFMLMKWLQEFIILVTLTINAYNISQFENHVRAVCKLEQIPLKENFKCQNDKYNW